MTFEIRSILRLPFCPMDFKEFSGWVCRGLEVAGRAEGELKSPGFQHVCGGMHKTEQKRICFYMASVVKEKLSWVHWIYFLVSLFHPLGRLSIPLPAASDFSVFFPWVQISCSRCLGPNPFEQLSLCPRPEHRTHTGHPVPLCSVFLSSLISSQLHFLTKINFT